MNLLLLVGAQLMLVMPALGKDQPAKPAKSLTLTKIYGESDEKGSMVNIILTRKPNWKTVVPEYHGTFIQIPLPGVTIPEPGKFFGGNSPYFDKLATFQIGAQTGAVRIFVRRDATRLGKAFNADVLGSRIMLYLDHKKLAGMGMTDHIPGDKTAVTIPVEKVVEKVEVRNDIEDPASKIPGAITGADAVIAGGKGAGNIRQKLVAASLFSAAMLTLMLVFFGVRRMRGRTVALGAGADAVTMKVLSSHTLAPRQRLTLMQIGGDQVLLTAGPEGIRYLTTIGGSHPVAMGHTPTPLPSASAAQPLLPTDMPAANEPLNAGKRARKVFSALESARKAPRRTSAGRQQRPKEVRTASRPAAGTDRVFSEELAKPAVKTSLTGGYTGAGAEARSQPASREKAVPSGSKKPFFNKAKKTGDQKPGSAPGGSQETIQDVTSLIRSKLKNLPPL